jgi:peptidoglycan hydrolase-like protein with peptidoglycan-binding domain
MIDELFSWWRGNIRGNLMGWSFELSIGELEPGEEDPELLKIQLYLVKLGYLKLGAYKPTRLDEATQQALRYFQYFHGIEIPTGTTDEETVEIIKAPRCGNKDLTELPPLEANGPEVEVGDFFAADLKAGCSYKGATTLTYVVENTARGLILKRAKTAIEGALRTWEEEIPPITFKPAQAGGKVDLRFKWAARVHLDNKPFDSIGGLIAHAFLPPSCPNNPNAGQCHFDLSEKWGLFDDPETRTFDLETLALHEIGHLLGLTHSSDKNSIMFPTYSKLQRALSEDARTAIRSIYT